MQNKHIFLAFIAIVFVGFGCKKDFLERSSLTQLAEGNFWNDEKDAQLGINGVYETLQDRAMYSGSLNIQAGLPMFDGLSDNCYNAFEWEGPGNFMEANVDPSTDWFRNLWVSCYRGIARANLAIEKIGAIPDDKISATNRNQFVAQAKFLRALYYFNLALYYEDVPLILRVQTLEESYVPKNTYNEVRDAIIKDLTEAAADLPVSYAVTEFGYATKGAALGLLARFQLYNKNYQAVLDATQPMLSMGYGLYGNYGNLFTPVGEKTNEIVFSVRFVQDQSNNGELFSGTFLGVPKGDMLPMRNLVRDYYCTDGKPITSSPLYNPNNQKLNRDPRLGASVYFNGDIFLTDLNRAFSGNTATTYGQRKYTRNSTSATGISVFSPGGQDFYVIRYADVLLMRAEALAELGRQAEAYPLVNQVRARVSMPSVEAAEGTGLSKDQMVQVIRHERRVELAFEGLRFFDLKRWGQVEAATLVADADPVGPYAPVYRGRKSEVFPIPLREMDANKSLVQNPVWN
jgi:hypothetical protein